MSVIVRFSEIDVKVEVDYGKLITGSSQINKSDSNLS